MPKKNTVPEVGDQYPNAWRQERITKMVDECDQELYKFNLQQGYIKTFSDYRTNPRHLESIKNLNKLIEDRTWWKEYLQKQLNSIKA